MPTQPMVEPVTTTAIMNAAEQEIAASCGETAPDGGVDWLVWLERMTRLAEGRYWHSIANKWQQIAKLCAVSIAIRG